MWDNWLQQTAQNGIYLANEEHFLVPSPEGEPAKSKALPSAPAQQRGHGPGAAPVAIAANIPRAGLNVAPQQLQRSGDVSATCDGAAQRVSSVGPAGQSNDPQIQALNTGVQREGLTNATGLAPATSSLIPSR